MFSYITICTDDTYVPGVIALNKSLHMVASKYNLNVLVDPLSVSENCIRHLKNADVSVIFAEHVEINDYIRKQNTLNQSPNWSNTLFKLRIFGLEQFDKIIYLDSDMIIIQNIDSLFSLEHMTSVQAGNMFDNSWVKLNSGLMVVHPKKQLEEELIALLSSEFLNQMLNGKGIGDQDVINWYYSDWPQISKLHLPESYNQFVTLLPQYQHYGYLHNLNDVYVLHYVGKTKPWNYGLCEYLHLIARALRWRSILEIKAVCIFWKIIG
ncbi:glycosyltransferase [Collinsella tanakaei]|uniref:glycosyltransferase n=1 Tax=Collinsella tanakaei TaxID=626935 RepID=UPI00195DF904|nr:glycosyltransferase [Collinsella tanakaei]MBM6868104.1 hypothetical protein [Collinsella tanakaei]